MKRWLIHTAAALVLGCCASLAAAQEQPLPKATITVDQPAPKTVVPEPLATKNPGVSVTVQELRAPCADPSGAGGPGGAGGGDPYSSNPFIRCLNKIGSACFSTHNSMGCSSCYAEYIFQFGTCRQFFGEKCLPPPPGPHPLSGISPFGGGCAGCAGRN